MIIHGYGMFSSAGSARVETIIRRAKLGGWDWEKILAELYKLSENKAYKEAYDTDVRDQVFSACKMKEVTKFVATV